MLAIQKVGGKLIPTGLAAASEPGGAGHLWQN
jgi:hypothetical protein